MSLQDSGSTTAWKQLRKWWATQLPLPCARCGQMVYANEQPPWELDHLIPRSDGGGDIHARPSHQRCNRSAGARYVEPMRQRVVDTSRQW